MIKVMIPIRLNRTHRALQRITGGRHTRRPCFDFEMPTYRDLASSSCGRFCDVTCLIGKGLTRLVISSDTRLFSKNIALNGVIRENTIAMAFNKLSIDKVELADKRVLIRYVYGSLKALFSCFAVLYLLFLLNFILVPYSTNHSSNVTALL